MKLTDTRRVVPPNASPNRLRYTSNKRALAVQNDATFIDVTKRHAHRLLAAPNEELLAQLATPELERLRALRSLVEDSSDTSATDFADHLYAIAGRGCRLPRQSGGPKSVLERIYRLLFGQSSGPRLSVFLRDADPRRTGPLLPPFEV